MIYERKKNRYGGLPYVKITRSLKDTVKRIRRPVIDWEKILQIISDKG